MKWMRFSILLLLVILTCAFCLISLLGMNSGGSREAVYSMKYIDSTKEWQDMACSFLKKRNDLINSILESKYSGNRKYIPVLKAIECKPLLDGDIELLDYMNVNPKNFTCKKSGINIEYSDIRKLAEDEVAMVAKMSYLEGGVYRETNWNIMFKMVGGKWMLSKLDTVN